jgi:hypothetical protein
MSFDASGTIAGAAVFSRWRGRNYVRRHAVPSNPKLPAQVAIRSSMKFLGSQYKLLPIVAADWLALAEAGKFSEFNAYVQFNMRRARLQQTPVADPATIGLVPPAAPTVAGTPGVRSATLVITPAGAPADWGYAIYRGLLATPASVWSNLIALVAGVGVVNYTDSPLLADTYIYAVQAFSQDGSCSLPTADETVVVP